MVVNPRVLSWRAPTENVDGSEIDYPLGYALLVDGDEVAVFPGALNPDGRYSVLFSELPTILGEASIALTAFDAARPERRSEPSAPIEVAFYPNPLPPTNLGASSE